MERWSERKSMQPVYGDNASRNTVNLNLSECFFKLVDNSWRVNRGTRYREGSLHTKHQVTVKSFKKKKNDGVLFLLLTLLVSTILDETLMAKAKQNGVSGWALMVRRRTSLNFESKCTLYQSKHYLNFSWSQSTQFVSLHKKFDVLSKALFFRRF